LKVVFFGFFLSITPTTFSKLRFVVTALIVFALLIKAGLGSATAISPYPTFTSLLVLQVTLIVVDGSSEKFKTI